MKNKPENTDFIERLKLMEEEIKNTTKVISDSLEPIKKAIEAFKAKDK